MRIFWLLLGSLAFVIGLAGMILPGIPGVALILLSAFCFARSSDRAYNYLINHPTFGPVILDWQKNGSIPIRAKFYATIMIVLAPFFSLWLGAPMIAMVFQILILIWVLWYIWSRPTTERLK